MTDGTQRSDSKFNLSHLRMDKPKIQHRPTMELIQEDDYGDDKLNCAYQAASDKNSMD